MGLVKILVVKLIQGFYNFIYFFNIKISISSKVSPLFLFKLNKNKKNIVIDGALIGSNVEINEGVKFFGESICVGNVKIGRYTSINGPSTRICAGDNGIEIGSFCSIASGVVIQEDLHKYDRVTSYYIASHMFKDKTIKESYSKGKILIEDDVWIGANSIILSGVTIGRGSIVGAGAIVTKNIPPYSIVVGTPAQIIKKRFSEETIKMLNESKWWTWDLEKIIQKKDFFFKKLY